MNRLIRLIFSILCGGTLILSSGDLGSNSTITAYESISGALPIHGSYKGKVYNNDRYDPVITTFTRSKSGTLEGSYIMGEAEGNIEPGMLTDIQIESKYSLRARWHDKYGSGTLRILFSSDYKKFTGYWGDDNTPVAFSWNGSRNQ